MRHSGRDDAGPRIPRADRGPVAAAGSARRAAGADTGRAAALALYRAADDHGREEDDGAPQVSHPLARQLRQYRQSAQCSGTRRSRSWCRDGALRWSRACVRDGTYGAYGGPPRPIPVAGPGYPPPPYFRPPPVWYPPPPRPWGPWWRPWRPWR